MNALDIIILLCFIPAIIQGVRKGLVCQIFDIVSEDLIKLIIPSDHGTLQLLDQVLRAPPVHPHLQREDLPVLHQDVA